MSSFTIHTVESAPGDSRATLAQVRERFGFVPNLLGALAGAPAALQAYVAAAAAFEATSLSPVERHVVLLTVSFENRCSYCMAAHSTAALAAGMAEGVVKALREDTPLAEPRLETLRRMTCSLVRTRGWVDRDTLAAFLASGYAPEQALEVLVGVAQKTLSNYANHLIGTPLDHQFKRMAWSTPGEAAGNTPSRSGHTEACSL